MQPENSLPQYTKKEHTLLYTVFMLLFGAAQAPGTEVPLDGLAGEADKDTCSMTFVLLSAIKLPGGAAGSSVGSSARVTI